jgi:hypothetical protein
VAYHEKIKGAIPWSILHHSTEPHMNRNYPSPSIPEEILEKIAGHVAHMGASPGYCLSKHLHHCSLASRAFRVPTQKEIFRKVILRPAIAPSAVDLTKRFADLVTQDKHVHLVRYVRSLTYQPHKGRRDEDVKIVSALSLLKFVEHFEFILAYGGLNQRVASDQPFFSCAWSPKSAWARAVLGIMLGTNVRALCLPIGCLGWPITQREFEAHTFNAVHGA